MKGNVHKPTLTFETTLTVLKFSTKHGNEKDLIMVKPKYHLQI